MYTEFYGLKEKPFNLTPSPRFLYLSEGHKEALAILNYGVMERMGFILLTGEVGTGKTTMVRVLLDNFDRSVQYVHLSNPLLSPEDFINYLGFSVFKKKIYFKSKAEFLLAFEQFLQRCLKGQKNFNLIIDEAQKLSFELLEEIRLLSNMETGDEKLINIFLVGQPELNQKLSEKRCRPLLQRISIRHQIPPLNLDETRDYMATRLKIAGAKKLERVFSKSAVEAIYNFSRGFPREINILADNALVLGYSKGTKKISPKMVEACYDDMQLDTSAPERSIQKSENREIREPELGHEQVETKPIGRHWKWAAILILLLAFSAVSLSPYGNRVFSHFVAFITSTHFAPPGNIPKQSVSSQNLVGEETQPFIETDTTHFQKPSAEEVETEKMQTVATEEVSVGENLVKETHFDTDEPAHKPIEEKSLPEKQYEEPYEVTRIVKEGDTLSSMAMTVYGRVDDNILNLVHRHNPHIKNMNWIDIGQEILFPKLQEPTTKGTFTVHIASYKTFESAFNMFRELLESGYEPYIITTNDPENGKIFRITLGYFKDQTEAQKYVKTIVNQGVSDYANAIQLEMK
jgi:type II secretory pathway predicted ATPase ExeA